MSSFQRVIKYCAMAFAIFLAVAIISGIANVVFAVVNFLPGRVSDTGEWSNDTGKWSNETVDYSKDFTGVESLEINHKFGDLRIEIGDTFRVEGENVPKNFEAEVKYNGQLTINYHSSFFGFPWFHFNGRNGSNCRVTVYIPADFVSDKTKIDAGAGNLSIDGLKTDRLDISAGAGNINGSNITSEKVVIDGGVGNIDLDDVNFHDTKLDCGVGNTTISGILLGKTDLDSGVGDVEFDITGNENDYSFDIDSGVGTVRLNGEKISDERRTGNGENEIKVDGGVGNVRINIQEE